MMARLQEKYKKEMVPALREMGGYANPMQVPRILQVVVNMGIKATVEKDMWKFLVDDLAKITGQKPLITKSRKSIANFKLREGMPVGLKVTLRGTRMFEFLDRLVSAALPRIRDFRGISAHSFDGKGNYNFGLREQMIFPEIDPDRVKMVQGMNITLTTSAKTDKEALELLKLFGFPFESA